MFQLFVFGFNFLDLFLLLHEKFDNAGAAEEMALRTTLRIIDFMQTQLTLAELELRVGADSLRNGAVDIL